MTQNAIAAFLSLLFATPFQSWNPQTFSSLWSKAQAQPVVQATSTPLPFLISSTPPIAIWTPAVSETGNPSTDQDVPGQEPSGGDGDGPTAPPVTFLPNPQLTPAPTFTPAPSEVTAPVGVWTWGPSPAPIGKWTPPASSPVAQPSTAPGVVSSALPIACTLKSTMSQFGPVSSCLNFPQWRGNFPVGPNPQLAPKSAQIIVGLAANGNGNLTMPNVNDDVLSFWTAQASDPQVTLSTQYSPAANGTYRIPVGACPAANSDHHLSVIQLDGTVLDIWEFNNGKCYAGGSSVSAVAAAVVPLSGTGFSSAPGWPAMAAGSSTRQGPPKMGEIATGVIPHAIEATPACSPNRALMGQATKSLGQSCRSGNVTGIAAGQYLWSDVTPAQLPANLDDATRMMCVALHDYGAVVDDTNGGWNSVSFNGLPATVGTEAPLYLAWARIHMGPGGTTNPSACFPGGWQAHLHVLAQAG
jgi:hypothetical protein